MKRFIMTAIAISALALACDKSNEPKPDDPAAKNGTTGATTTTPTTTAAPTPVTVADSDLSTPADFEEAAEKAITAKNYKQELATLEKDVEKE